MAKRLIGQACGENVTEAYRLVAAIRPLADRCEQAERAAPGWAERRTVQRVARDLRVQWLKAHRNLWPLVQHREMWREFRTHAASAGAWSGKSHPAIIALAARRLIEQITAVETIAKETQS